MWCCTPPSPLWAVLLWVVLLCGVYFSASFCWCSLKNQQRVKDKSTAHRRRRRNAAPATKRGADQQEGRGEESTTTLLGRPPPPPWGGGVFTHLSLWAAFLLLLCCFFSFFFGGFLHKTNFKKLLPFLKNWKFERPTKCHTASMKSLLYTYMINISYRNLW